MTSPVLPKAAVEIVIGRIGSCGGRDVHPVDAVWPSRLRATTRHLLTVWGFDLLADSAELVVSELVTNAFMHGVGDVRFRLYQHADCIRIEIGDESSKQLAPGQADDSAEIGRGLALVGMCSSDWGVSDDGRTVWSELGREPDEFVTAGEAA